MTNARTAIVSTPSLNLGINTSAQKEPNMTQATAFTAVQPFSHDDFNHGRSDEPEQSEHTPSVQEQNEPFTWGYSTEPERIEPPVPTEETIKEPVHAEYAETPGTSGSAPVIPESSAYESSTPEFIPHVNSTPESSIPESSTIVNEKLTEINQLIAPYKLAYVHPANDCVLLDRNARYMTKEQQERLSENIKQDGFLSQLPFGIRQPDGKYKIISGNHRIKAAIKAQLPAVLLLYGDEDDFDAQRQLAIQLSHNAVTGQDDPMLLKTLYLELDDIVAKMYTGINEREVLGYKMADIASIAEKDIELAEVRLMFCEPEKERVLKLLDGLENYLGIERANGTDKYSDSLVFMEQDWFIDTMTKVQKKFQIKNRSTAILKMCSIVEDAIANKGTSKKP